MICVHCGKEIDNGQAFCPYCGSRVGGDAAPEAKAAKKDPRKLALPVAAVALLAVVGVGLANRMPSIDLQRYVTITAQGYDTLGKLDVSFDTDKLEADYYYAGAAQGDAECAAAVGYCCEMDPRGSNLPLALAWYQHAAKAGSAWAMEKVATFYEEGYGCTANRALADACRETLKYMR